MYAIVPQQIPQNKRAEINEKILFAIKSLPELMAKRVYTTAIQASEDCMTSSSRTSPTTTSMPRRRRSSKWDSSSHHMRYVEIW